MQSGREKHTPHVQHGFDMTGLTSVHCNPSGADFPVHVVRWCELSRLFEDSHVWAVVFIRRAALVSNSILQPFSALESRAVAPVYFR